ncbi:Second ORF in transposon ISC1359 [Saccharolobus solfataricus P2]|uniref:Second ORF in transposon ISC1359 n=2 Tax=Saccharolobus solfataricus TaxID=2287 RepID=Q97VP9_SACS2|nr:Second ORF in transposon ISC1359 [Saccharolobus solfataricus P2]SAI86247.1 uncharacterised protein [Saccharolobus solfataricus]
MRKELVLVLLSYLLLNVWFLIRSWRKVKLWEFSVSLSNLLDREVRVEQGRAFREVKTSFPKLQLTLCTSFQLREINS